MNDGRSPMLTVTGLVVRYGPITAVQNIDLVVGAGELVALVGPNGAGKTSTLSAISGSPAMRRRVRRDERDRAHRAGARGRDQAWRRPRARGTQHLRLLTVEENLLLGATIRKTTAPRANDIETELERFPILRDRLHATGRPPVGRRAAATRHRQGVAQPTATAAARRTVARSGAPARRSRVRHHQRPARSRRDDPPGRAERDPRHRIGRPLLHHADGGRIVRSGTADQLAGGADLAADYLGGDIPDADLTAAAPVGVDVP